VAGICPQRAETCKSWLSVSLETVDALWFHVEFADAIAMAPIVGLCVALGGPALLAGPAGSILGNPARLTSHIIDQRKSRLRIVSIVVTCANDT
jgi:hypothetical protein